jgi:hypothetical protein
MSAHAVSIFLILTLSVVVFFVLRAGENLRFETPTDPRRVVMAAVAIVATKRHWQVLTQGNDGASFRYQRGPNPFIALVLLFLFVVPGIVYIVLAGKRESLVLNIHGDKAGGTVAQLTSNGFRGKFAGRALARQVSVMAGVAAIGAPVAGAGAHAGASTLPSTNASAGAGERAEAEIEGRLLA